MTQAAFRFHDASDRERLACIRDMIRTYVVNDILLDADASLGDGDSLLDSGIVDSTCALELIEYLQKTFGIAIRDDEIVPDNFESIERLSWLVASKVAPSSVHGVTCAA